MILAVSSLFVCLEFIGRHPGLLLVLIGVTGEIVCDWKEMEGRLARAKRISAILLVVGLMMEFWEAAKFDNEVAVTKERTALVESNNLALRSNVAALELQVAQTSMSMAKIDPLNLPISDVSVSVNFILGSTNAVELPYDSSPVAQLILCEVNMRPVNSGGNMILTADNFKRFSVLNINGEIIDCGYALYFHADPLGISSPCYFNGKSVSEIVSNVNYLEIAAKFLPRKASLAVGQAEMTINGSIHKHFDICAQKGSDFTDLGVFARFGGATFTIIATNIVRSAK